MFGQDLKCNFLKKKKQQKMKTQQQSKQNTNALKVQNVVRSFLNRRQIQKLFLQENNINSQGLLFLRSSHKLLQSQKPQNQIKQKLLGFLQQLKKLIVANSYLNNGQKDQQFILIFAERYLLFTLESEQTFYLAFQLLEAFLQTKESRTKTSDTYKMEIQNEDKQNQQLQQQQTIGIKFVNYLLSSKRFFQTLNDKINHHSNVGFQLIQYICNISFEDKKVMFGSIQTKLMNAILPSKLIQFIRTFKQSNSQIVEKQVQGNMADNSMGIQKQIRKTYYKQSCCNIALAIVLNYLADNQINLTDNQYNPKYQDHYKNKMQLEVDIKSQNSLRKGSIQSEVSEYGNPIFQQTLQSLGGLLMYIVQTKECENGQVINQDIFMKNLTYLLKNILEIVRRQHTDILQRVINEYNHLYVLIEDQEDMEYFQNKIMSHPLMSDFSDSVLTLMQKIYNSPQIINIFFNNSTINKMSNSGYLNQVKSTLLETIRFLMKIFEDRKLLFIRNLLSSDELLRSLFEIASKKQGPISYQFYQGLKMKLLAMDDQQFVNYNTFDKKQWEEIIQKSIDQSWQILKDNKNLTSKYSNKVSNTQKLQNKPVPFAEKSNETYLQLKSYSEIIENLYKKSLRTKKLPENIFLHNTLSLYFQQFSHFGSQNTVVLEKLLQLFPFCFTFETRLQKFRSLIKQDKLNHDRTLFLLEEVDEDLIITVRRGHQFLDAFSTCINRDLRKKYKIIFYNEQGLEQEGIDGGGLIKEFINRVLSSGFSEIYGLFQQTSMHEIIPNPYSNEQKQYEFIGKIIGKAIYEGITIQQKFAQPFLNLLIGRKNTFQDLQYIDPQIYKSLLDIKNLKQNEVQQIQQTWVILDQQPNGIKKYIDLSKQQQFKQKKGNKQKKAQTLVTSSNKLDFIMSYSDYKCNKQLEEKTRYFKKGFLQVMKPEWLTLFNNQQLNRIISGSEVDFPIQSLKHNCVYVEYHEKDITIKYFWEVLSTFTPDLKSKFLLYVTSCSRPPTLGFSSYKPKICISKDDNIDHLPTANTCMNVLRLPNYKNKQLLKQKLLYAIQSKAGFQFA